MRGWPFQSEVDVPHLASPEDGGSCQAVERRGPGSTRPPAVRRPRLAFLNLPGRYASFQSNEPPGSVGAGRAQEPHRERQQPLLKARRREHARNADMMSWPGA